MPTWTPLIETIDIHMILCNYLFCFLEIININMILRGLLIGYLEIPTNNIYIEKLFVSSPVQERIRFIIMSTR